MKRGQKELRLNERIRQNCPHIPLPFPIISFKSNRSEGNLSVSVCHTICVTAGEASGGGGVITTLKWWNSLVMIINRLCCTLFTFS